MLIESKYETCMSCEKARAEGNFEVADHCHSCKGKGFNRKPSSFPCNQCGNSMCPTVDTPNASIPHGLVEAKVSGGYDSPHLTDTAIYTFSLCEKCLRTLFAECKIKPHTVWYGENDSIHSYEEDAAYYKRRLWVESGAAKARIPTGICNYSEECPNVAILRSFCSGSRSDRVYCAQHAEGAALNEVWVLVSKLKGLSEDRSTWTREDEEQEALAWFETTLRPGVVTYYRYLPDLVSSLTKLEENVGGFWVPSNIATPDWIVVAAHFHEIQTGNIFGTGSLFSGPFETMKELARLHPKDVLSPESE